jgi:hypothetical protein
MNALAPKINKDAPAPVETIFVPAPVETTPAKVMVRVLRDYWTDELDTEGMNKRVRAGTLLEVDAMTALDMVETGSVERVR